MNYVQNAAMIVLKRDVMFLQEHFDDSDKNVLRYELQGSVPAGTFGIKLQRVLPAGCLREVLCANGKNCEVFLQEHCGKLSGLPELFAIRIRLLTNNYHFV